MSNFALYLGIALTIALLLARPASLTRDFDPNELGYTPIQPQPPQQPQQPRVPERERQRPASQGGGVISQGVQDAGCSRAAIEAATDRWVRGELSEERFFALLERCATAIKDFEGNIPRTEPGAPPSHLPRFASLPSEAELNAAYRQANTLGFNSKLPAVPVRLEVLNPVGLSKVLGQTNFDDETGQPVSILLNPEVFKRRPEDIVATLVHEMVHIEVDTRVKGEYHGHDRVFCEAARAVAQKTRLPEEQVMGEACTLRWYQ